MKICHIVTTIERGGAENQLLLLSKYQRLMGHHVTVVPLQGEAQLEEDFVKNGVEVSKSLINRNFVLQVYAVKKRFELQHCVVHCHLPRAELLARFAGLRNYLITRHYGGAFYPRKPRLWSSFLSRIATQRSSFVIAISQFTAKNLLDRNEIADRNRIRVIPYGFESNSFVLESKRCLAVEHSANTFEKKWKPKGEFSFICVARLSPEKSLPTLLKAYAELRESYPMVTLSIYGDGPERKKLEKLCRSLGISFDDTFRGRVPQVGSRMLESDALILPSIFEGFGMVLLEAMSLEKQIISSDIPVAREVLGVKGAAQFFSVGDWKDLKEKMSKVLQNTGKQYIQAQREQLQKFGMNRLNKSLEELYKESRRS